MTLNFQNGLNIFSGNNEANFGLLCEEGVLSPCSYGDVPTGTSKHQPVKIFKIAETLTLSKIMWRKNTGFRTKLTRYFYFDCSSLFLSNFKFKKWHIEAENVIKTCN